MPTVKTLIEAAKAAQAASDTPELAERRDAVAAELTAGVTNVVGLWAEHYDLPADAPTINLRFEPAALASITLEGFMSGAEGLLCEVAGEQLQDLEECLQLTVTLPEVPGHFELELDWDTGEDTLFSWKTSCQVIDGRRIYFRTLADIEL